MGHWASKGGMMAGHGFWRWLQSFHGWFNQPKFTGQGINIVEEIRRLGKNQSGTFQLSNGFVGESLLPSSWVGYVGSAYGVWGVSELNCLAFCYGRRF